MHLRSRVESLRLLAFVLLMGLVQIASADSSIAEKMANQQSLRTSVEAGEGKFARLHSADRTRILRAQDTIFALLEGRSATTELSHDDLSRIDDAESEIARLVASLDPPATKAKVKCSYEARIGSNRKEKVCREVGSKDPMRVREQFRKLQRQ